MVSGSLAVPELSAAPASTRSGCRHALTQCLVVSFQPLGHSAQGARAACCPQPPRTPSFLCRFAGRLALSAASSSSQLRPKALREPRLPPDAPTRARRGALPV